MSLTMRPALRWAAVICSRVTPQRFIQYSTACRSERSSRSLSMKPRLSFKPAIPAPLLSRAELVGGGGGLLRRHRRASGQLLRPGLGAPGGELGLHRLHGLLPE